jgi:hypothetical protein
VSVQSINNSHLRTLATFKPVNIKAKQSTPFSLQAALSLTSLKQPVRQLLAAAPQVRQSAAALVSSPVSSNLTTTDNMNNPTAMWTPNEGWLNNGDPIGPAKNTLAQPFYIANPNHNPADSSSPSMIQDPTATATPNPVQWTSANGLTTAGVMNPFGLTQNNPGLGFFGIPT